MGIFLKRQKDNWLFDNNCFLSAGGSSWCKLENQAVLCLSAPFSLRLSTYFANMGFSHQRGWRKGLGEPFLFQLMKLTPFLGSSLLLPWTCDWSTALDLSLLDQCPMQGFLELGLGLEEKPVHVDSEAMVLERVVVDVIGVPPIPH